MSAIAQATQHIKDADALLITAGAGMGIDSGLPDFRGKQGFWRAFPPLAHLQVDFVSMANPILFDDNPRLAWGFYGLRLTSYRNTMPHQGFFLLKSWSDAKPYGSFIFTSNVDGQFIKAGFSDEQMMECHGSIHHLQCTRCCTDDIWRADDFYPDVDVDICMLINDGVLCPHCQAIARPNILMFGDDRWLSWRTDAQEQRLSHYMHTLPTTARLTIIEMGAGSSIPTVRSFGERLSRHYGAPLIRINPTESHIAPNITGVSLPMGALAALTAINELL